MSLFKKPSELQPKFAISALIYGSPGSGKSTLACSTANAALLDYDGGVTRIHGAHQVPTLQVTSWEQTQQALEEIKNNPDIHSIVVDTVGKMLSFMDEYIKRTQPKMKKYDGSLSLQGYGVRKQMFVNFIKDATIMGKNVIFVAHDKEEKRGDDTVVRPEIGGSSAADLMKELDLVGYMEMIGNQRTIAFDPCERYYAKNTCGMPGKIQIPLLIDDNGNILAENNFMCQVVNAYQKRQQDNLNQTARYELLCAQIKERIDSLENANDCNNFVAWIGRQEHIFNSKAKALSEFQAKVKTLDIDYNKSTKKYADKLSDNAQPA